MRLTIASILLLALSGSLFAEGPKSASLRRLDGSHISVAEAEAFARKTLSAAKVTGAQIAVMDRGRLVWSMAYGLRHTEPPAPMERDTTTWAASITKGIFATYVMQLVERGEFNLDQPVAKQLPKALDQYEPYRQTASALVRDPAWPAVTPRMLLAHTGGLANFASLEPDKKMHLHFTPGTQFQYSGEGINLVQYIIEQQKQKPLDELMQAAIFGPLGMARTSLTYREEFAANIADRYDAEWQFVAQTRRMQPRAAGSMTASAEDLARFASAWFAGTVLKKPTRKIALTPFIRIHTPHQFGSRPDDASGKEADAVGLAYGMGWGLLMHTKFGRAFFKEGHGDGAQNYMICFERRQTCMIVLTNSDNGEAAFRPLLETILGDSVTPWEWEGYTAEGIAESRKHP